MKNLYILFLFLSLPFLVMAQFNIGQSTGAHVTYYDFPDTSVCSWGLESLQLDLDGDQIDDLRVNWYLGTPHQDCFDRVCGLARIGTGVLGMLPDYSAQGNDLVSQTYYQGLDLVDYCPSYSDSTNIVRIWLDHFGAGGGYMLLKLDSLGLDYAWLRASPDTANGNFCLTFLDAARYRPPVSADPASGASAGLEVFPTIVEDALWIKSDFKKPVRLNVKYYTIGGRQLGQAEMALPSGQSTMRVAYPDVASGVGLMEISGENFRKVEKLMFSK